MNKLNQLFKIEPKESRNNLSANKNQDPGRLQPQHSEQISQNNQLQRADLQGGFEIGQSDIHNFEDPLNNSNVIG